MQDCPSQSAKSKVRFLLLWQSSKFLSSKVACIRSPFPYFIPFLSLHRLPPACSPRALYSEVHKMSLKGQGISRRTRPPRCRRWSTCKYRSDLRECAMRPAWTEWAAERPLHSPDRRRTPMTRPSYRPRILPDDLDIAVRSSRSAAPCRDRHAG